MPFKFSVYSNRFGRHSTYSVNKTDDGWYISHISINGDSNCRGVPHLYKNFEQDNISYPSGLPLMLEHLWEQLSQDEISHHDAQDRLDELAEWVSTCERATPKWEEWN